MPNTMAADKLQTPGAIASSAMVFGYLEHSGFIITKVKGYLSIRTQVCLHLK